MVNRVTTRVMLVFDYMSRVILPKRSWRRKLNYLFFQILIRCGAKALQAYEKWVKGGYRDLLVIKDVPYLPHPRNTLDVYKNKIHPNGQPLLPVLVYIHGGSFSMLSKETHWVFAQKYCQMGLVVFTINYRLAPQHRFPRGLEDCMHALLHIKEAAPYYGGDPNRIILAGESAGANLALSLTLASFVPCAAPFDTLYHTPIRIVGCIPACGILQLTDIERFRRNKSKPFPVAIEEKVKEVGRFYLPEGDADHIGKHPLAEPLLLLESLHELPVKIGPEGKEIPFPSFYTLVGTMDPLLDDSRRLDEAVRKLGGQCEIDIYPGGIHAFHALPFHSLFQKSWQKQNQIVQQMVQL